MARRPMLSRMAKLAIGLSIVALLAAIGGALYHGTVRIDGAVSGGISGIGSLGSQLLASRARTGANTQEKAPMTVVIRAF